MGKKKEERQQIQQKIEQLQKRLETLGSETTRVRQGVLNKITCSDDSTFTRSEAIKKYGEMISTAEKCLQNHGINLKELLLLSNSQIAIAS